MTAEKVTCEDCKHLNGYVTGDDEYPQRTYVCWCSKGHWENGDPQLLQEIRDLKDKIWDLEYERDEENDKLQDIIKDQEKDIEDLKKQVEELESQLTNISQMGHE